MKRRSPVGLQIAAILLASGVVGIAQTNGNLNSGQSSNQMPPPGAVNYVEGQVSVGGQQLSQANVRSVVLGSNQAVDTGQGYAEVLLTPGSFLRIGHDSEVQFKTAGLANVQFAVVRGSALVEVADLVKGSRLAVDIGGSTADVLDKGLYSFNANGNAIRVLDGKLRVLANDRTATLHKGDEVLLTSADPMKKQNFDKKAVEGEQLYVWSRVRSQQEEAANVNMANSLLASGAWNGPGWYWDPYWSFYSFVPGYGFLGGPFGFGFYSPYVVRGGFYGRGFYGHGFYGHGFYGRGYYGRGYYSGLARPGFRGGIGSVHAAGGMHAMHGGGRR